jgi:glycosyltransferase involved in cell wall biosynthesis
VRIAFLTSTPLDFVRGSGTFAGISTLASAAQELGAQTEFFTPLAHMPVYTAERLWFNRRLRRVNFDRFDVVVGFDMDGYLAAGRHGVPHVASIKGVIADEMRFERGITRRLMSIQAGCERRHVSRANLVITTSRYAASRIEKLYGFEKPLRIVPECIDLAGWRDFFSRNPAKPDPAKFTVLCVCRFYPRKRLEVLLRAAARLRTRIPVLEVRIVGGGPEESKLLNLWRKLHLEGAVRWLGSIPQASLAREYQNCDVFCLPSIQEGFGIVFLEAMAAAKPVVAADAAAVPEVVPDGIAGLLAEPENDQALADRILRLHADPALRAALGQAGLRIVERYDAPRVAGLFLDELAALTAERR